MAYFIFILSFFIFSTTYASCLEKNIIKNQFLVVTPEDLSTSFSIKTGLPKPFLKKISSSKKISVPLKTNTQKILNTYLTNSNSLSKIQKIFPTAKIQNDCKVSFLRTVPNSDPFLSFQNWYFNSLNQNPSSILIPLRDIVVAVSDTGVDIDHIDLKKNLWTNSAELNGFPNIDDDHNGYIDDIYGYDFGDNDSNPKPTTKDSFIDYDHGTHVAGLIAARSFNNEGVSSISLNSIKIMSLKGFKSNAPSSISDLLKTIYYAVDNGANIINASWGTEKLPEAAEIAAVNYATQNGVVIVASAGNDRIPASWFTPGAIKSVVTVASVNSSNQLSTFSNYGSSIDFISPGGDGPERSSESLLSLGLGSSYLQLKGTSMAAPLIAGLIGSLMSQSKSLTAFQALHVLKESGDNFILQPYLQNNDSRLYTKPNFLKALHYLDKNKDLPNIKIPLDEVKNYTYSKNFTNSLKSNGGCSNSLLKQPYTKDSYLKSQVSFLNLLFFLLPFLTILGIKNIF